MRGLDIYNTGKIKLSKYVYFEFNENEVVCLNQKFGLWVKISRECYDLIINAEKDNLSIGELVNMFFEEDDKKYISNLIDKLQQVHALVDESDEEINQLENVDIMVTERCNLSCKHCAADANKVDGKEYFSTYEMIKILDKVMDCQPKVLVITGGEPLLRSDIFELLRYAKSRGEVKINLMTNGTLINESNIAEIADLVNSIDISIDGYDEESCSYVRGKGVFDKVLKSIDLIKQRTNIPIAISMVKLRNSEFEEFKFRELCEKLEVHGGLRRLSYSGRAKDNWDYLNNFSNSNEKLPLNCKRKNPSYQELKSALKSCSCNGGITSLSLDAKGNIFPCAPFSEIVNNVTNIKEIDNLTTFINSKKLECSNTMKRLFEYSPYHGEICKQCNVKSFCLTCPYAAYEILSDKEQFENICKEKKEYLQKLVWGTSF